MPIYEYKSTGEGCSHCSKVFQALQMIQAPPLSHCPCCGDPVERVFSSFSMGSNLLGKSNLRDHGFTKLVRKDKGVYENVTK